MIERRYIKAVKCEICGKRLLDSEDIKVRHIKLSHGKNYCPDYDSPCPDADKLDIPISYLKDLKEFKRAKREMKIHTNNKKNNNNNKKKSKRNPEHRSIYWGRVITSAFETKR